MTAAMCSKAGAEANSVVALIDSHAAGYAGEVSPEQAFQYLQHNSAVLVDVRTQPEWQFVGAPDLRDTPSQLVLASWKTYPTFESNADFVPALSQHISSKDTPIFFICRSGGRSLDAAMAMTEAGYRYCFNVTAGFEGEPDATGKRCTREGWVAANLPWSQT